MRRALIARGLALAALGLPCELLAWKWWGGTGFAIVAVVAGILGAAGSLLYARCPACRLYVGGSGQLPRLRRCPRCGAQFR